MQATGYWRNAGRNWNGMGFPLSPGLAEMDVYREILGPTFDTLSDVLILGVTPQLQDLGWSNGCKVEAADYSEQMIQTFWRGATDAAMHCDWRDIPRNDHSYDAILTDGGSVMVPWPEGLIALAHSVRRLLKPEGCFVTRVYLTPDDHSSFADIREQMLAGRIRNMSAYKLLAGMANSAETSAPSRLRDVYRRTMNEIDGGAFHQMTGCTPAEVASFENYRDADDAYHFVRRREFLTVMESKGFRPVAERESAAQWGYLCPVFRFEVVP